MCKESTENNWIVRVERRSDGRIFYIDKGGDNNPRYSEANKFSYSVAVQYAKAIREQSKVFTAHASRFVNTDEGTKREDAKE